MQPWVRLRLRIYAAAVLVLFAAAGALVLLVEAGRRVWRLIAG